MIRRIVDLYERHVIATEQIARSWETSNEIAVRGLTTSDRMAAAAESNFEATRALRDGQISLLPFDLNAVTEAIAGLRDTLDSLRSLWPSLESPSPEKP